MITTGGTGVLLDPVFEVSPENQVERLQFAVFFPLDQQAMRKIDPDPVDIGKPFNAAGLAPDRLIVGGKIGQGAEGLCNDRGRHEFACLRNAGAYSGTRIFLGIRQFQGGAPILPGKV